MTERPKSSHEPSIAKEPIVLVVEDDASMRRALSNLFGSVGLVVELFVTNICGQKIISVYSLSPAISIMLQQESGD